MMQRRAVIKLIKSIQFSKALATQLRETPGPAHHRVFAWTVLSALSAAETAAEGLLTEIEDPQQDAATERMKRKEAP